MIYVLNFKKLTKHEIYRQIGGFTKLSVVNNELILFDRLQFVLRIIPFQRLVDKRFYTLARNIKNHPDDVINDPMLQEFKDVVLHPSYIDLTHFCTHYKAYSALK